jgi:hypothetical protein
VVRGTGLKKGFEGILEARASSQDRRVRLNSQNVNMEGLVPHLSGTSPLKSNRQYMLLKESTGSHFYYLNANRLIKI